MRVVEDRWLASVLERAVYRVETGADGQTEGVEALASHASGQGRAFYYAKVGTDSPAGLRDLLATGMGLMEIAVTLRLRFDALVADASAGRTVVVEEARARDEPGVLEVASTAFRYSRFHVDPSLPRALADRVKVEWMRNAVAGRRGDRVFVARRDGTVAGFLAALRTSDAAVIDLVAVAPAQQGCGVGRALVDRFVRHYASSGLPLEVGTQLVNVRSLRLYEGRGFGIQRSAFVLHGHVRDGRWEGGQ